MRVVACPEHEETVSLLARGRLAPSEGTGAEALLGRCEHCATWWRDELGGEAFQIVDAEVEKAIYAFRRPRRKIADQWAYLAAVFALAVVVGSMSLMQGGGEESGSSLTDQGLVAGQADGAVKRPGDQGLISAEDFEEISAVRGLSGAVAFGSQQWDPVIEAVALPTTRDPSVIFADDLEFGHLEQWHEHS